MPRTTHTFLLTLVLACDPVVDTTSTSTSSSESSTSTTAEPSTGDEGTSSSADTGSTSGLSGGPTTTTGEPPAGTCPGVALATCGGAGVWCVDLVAFCEQIDLKNQSPNFCAGLGVVCLEDRIERCEYCSAFAEQCTLEGRLPAECTAIEEECACLAGAD